MTVLAGKNYTTRDMRLVLCVVGATLIILWLVDVYRIACRLLLKSNYLRDVRQFAQGRTKRLIERCRTVEMHLAVI